MSRGPDPPSCTDGWAVGDRSVFETADLEEKMADLEEKRRERFCAWIADNSCVCSLVEPTNMGAERGWGGVAQEPISHGETLLAFPCSMLLDVSAAQRSPQLGPELARFSQPDQGLRCAAHAFSRVLCANLTMHVAPNCRL